MREWRERRVRYTRDRVQIDVRAGHGRNNTEKNLVNLTEREQERNEERKKEKKTKQTDHRSSLTTT